MCWRRWLTISSSCFSSACFISFQICGEDCHLIARTRADCQHGVAVSLSLLRQQKVVLRGQSDNDRRLWVELGIGRPTKEVLYLLKCRPRELLAHLSLEFCAIDPAVVRAL
jgi:hypothetical protein